MRPAAVPTAPSAACSICGQPGAGSSGHHQRHAVRRTDVGGALRVAGAAGTADRGPELLERLVDVAEVAQHDARGLVGDGGDLGAGTVGEESASGRERLVRTGEGEGQQPVQVWSG